jgi:hypothetical protein
VRSPLLLALALAVPLWGAEPVAATPWDVRKQAQELIDDLTNHRGDPSALLERAQQLMVEHGTALIATKNGSAPIAVVVPDKLRELGMDQAFVQTFEGPATRRLKDAADGDEAALLAIASGYPGTKAAASAWSRLADRAWDSGELNRFLAYARAAGDAALAPDTPRRKRVEAAMAMLAPERGPELPASLELSDGWSLPFQARHAPASRFTREQHMLPQALALCATPDATAASDGLRLVVIDHLIGRIQGQELPIGNVALDQPRQYRPIAIHDGFTALGKQNERIVLVAVDRLGQRLWQATSPAGGQQSAALEVSPPVALDRLVAYAVTMLDDENVDLRVQAFDQRTGKLAWDTLVARLPGGRRAMYMGEAQFPPLACTHAGSLLVLSNCGVIARLSADGAVQRVWSYPSTADDVAPGMANIGRIERLGAILSDGATAVATPADNAGMALLIGDDGDPRIYKGDGAGGDVIAVDHGVALLSGRILTCLDLAAEKPRWSKKSLSLRGQAPTAQSWVPQAWIDGGRALLYSAELWALIDLATGEVVSQHYPLPQSVTPPERCDMAVVDQLVMFGSSSRISASGGSTSSYERLLAVAEQEPRDYRPRVRLAALLEARHDDDQAYGRYLEALQRGAPPEYAELAARLVRSRLDLALGDLKTFPPALERLGRLVEFDPALRDESALWRARDAETRGDKAGAADGYRSVLRGAGRSVHLNDNIEAHTHTLAHGGLYRLGLEKGGLAGEEPAHPLPTATSDWSMKAHRARTTLIAHDLALSYSDGFLVATRIADGTEAWWRHPYRSLLGVQSTPEQRDDGVLIKVMPGTSAEAAGLRSGDVLVEFNGRHIRRFAAAKDDGDDLVNAVRALKPRSKYTAVAQRGDERVSVEGVLGGDLVEPIAANDRTVLAWPTLPDGGAEGMWVAALDLQTGEELCPRLTGKAANQEGPPAAPLLTSDDVMIYFDAQDLIAVAPHAGAHDAPAGRVLWRLEGQAGALSRARIIGEKLLWLPDAAHARGDLIELATGAQLASVPCEGEQPPLIDGFDCFTRRADAKACCWDLGNGRLRWCTQADISSIVLARGDAVYAIRQDGVLIVLDRASGKERRAWGDWTGVSALGISGDRLYLKVRARDREEVAAITLTGGTVAWEQPLPARAETQAFLPSALGLSLVEREGDAGWVLTLGPDGAPSRIDQAGAEHQFFPLTEGVLDAGPDGMRVSRAKLPPVPPTLPSAIAAEGADLTAIAKETLPALRWQECGGCSYALARSHGSLLVFMRGERDLALHLGDAGMAIDCLGQVLTFSPSDGSPRFDPGEGGWRLGDHAKLGTDHGDALVARLDPPADRIPNQPLSVRAEVGADSDGPATPWWLSAVWRTVTVIEPPDPKKSDKSKK